MLCERNSNYRLHLPVRLGRGGKKNVPKTPLIMGSTNMGKKEKSTILKVLFYRRKEKAKEDEN